MSNSGTAESWSIPRFIPEGGEYHQHRPEHECEQMLAAARQRAAHLRREILAEAQEQAAFIRDQAREEGFMEGYREAEEQGQMELQTLLAQQKSHVSNELARLFAEREESWSYLVDELSGHLHEIAVCCCKKLFDFIPPEKALPREQILKAIQSVGDGNTVQLRVHPNQREGWPSHLALEIVTDPELSERDFYLKGDAGVINGSWHERWSEMKSILEADID